MLAGIHEIELLGPSATQLLGHLALYLACMATVGLVERNDAAERLFGFEQRDAPEQNMLWMLFADDRQNSRIMGWAVQAPQVLASFRRDFAQAPEDESMVALVEALEQVSPSFRILWNQHDVHGRCEGRRSFMIDGQGRWYSIIHLSSWMRKNTCALCSMQRSEISSHPPIFGESVGAIIF